MLLRVAVLVLALAVYVECQNSYDCRRTNTPCQGTCITNGANAGSCLCSAGRVGYDCSLTGTLITPVACTNPNCNFVSVNRFCYRNAGGNDLCPCTAGFTGATCNTARVRTVCGTASMQVFVDPLPGANFAGRVFVKDNSACDFSVQGASTVFWRNTTLNSCGLTPVQQTNGDITYTLVVVVQYSSMFQTALDEEHIAVCRHTTDGTVFGSVGVQPAASRPGQTVQDSTVVTHMELVAAATNLRLTSASIVTMGDNLEIRIVLDSTAYATLYTSRCAVYNVSSSAGPRAEKLLVQNGCILNPAALNVVIPPMTRIGNIITLTVDAFKFDSSDQLHFECDVIVCRTLTDAACLPETTCGSVQNGFGRKKRQAEDGADMKTVSAGVRVMTNGDVNILPVSCPDTQPIQEPCIQSVPFVAVTAVFGVLLLVALAASAFLCFRFSRRERRHDVKKIDPPAYVNPAMSTA